MSLFDQLQSALQVLVAPKLESIIARQEVAEKLMDRLEQRFDRLEERSERRHDEVIQQQQRFRDDI